jgi:hypothetical protein
MILLALPLVSVAQEDDKEDMERIQINGEWMYAIVTEDDTLYVADLDGTSITMPRKFKSKEDKRRYYKLKRSAQKVYPYAVKAIKIYKETEEVTEGMKRRKRKKYTKSRQKELKAEFEDELKKMTKTQGKVLIAMIERELDTSFFKVLKSIRNGFTATYWNALGKIYGYKLKEKYDPEVDPIMEMVLSDFDINLED